MQTVHVGHVPDVMLPSELQTCAPEPARARVHRWCVMARGGATAGGGAAARHGARAWAAWRLGQGTRATSDVLAALYSSSAQAAQPVVQPVLKTPVGPSGSQSKATWSSDKRRGRAPSTPPVIGDSGASLSSNDRSCQPLAVESMARWTSTRPTVIGEEAAPRSRSLASATGAAATVASRALRSFGDGAPSESPISSG